MNTKELPLKQIETGEIPEGWEFAPLSELASVNEKAIDKNFPFKEIEYIDIASVDKGRVLEIRKVQRGEAPSRAQRICRNNDILLSTVRPNLKHFAFLKETRPNTIASTGFAVITAKEIDPRFLYYYLTTDKYTDYLSAIADGHTSTYPAFNPDVLENSLIQFPPISEQRAIAEILGDLDEKIELNHQMNKTLEAIAQAIFKRWFVDFNFPDEKGHPYKDSGGHMVDSELGKIPEGWNAGRFSDFVSNVKEALKPGEEICDRKYVPIESLPMKQIGMIDDKSYLEAQSSLVAFEKNDILFGAMRAYFHRVNFAPYKGVTRTTTFVLRPHKLSYLSYGLFLLNLESSVHYANLHSKGSTMPYAVWENSLAEMPAVVPDESALDIYHGIIYPLLQRIGELSEQNKILAKIRDSLLPKLMSGKIRIKPVDFGDA